MMRTAEISPPRPAPAARPARSPVRPGPRDQIVGSEKLPSNVPRSPPARPHIQPLHLKSPQNTSPSGMGRHARLAMGRRARPGMGRHSGAQAEAAAQAGDEHSAATGASRPPAETSEAERPQGDAKARPRSPAAPTTALHRCDQPRRGDESERGPVAGRPGERTRALEPAPPGRRDRRGASDSAHTAMSGHDPAGMASTTPAPPHPSAAHAPGASA